MKNIEIIKEDLIKFGEKYNACEEGLEAIKGDTLTELFANISPYINWCKENKEKTKEFNSIFNNELVIEDGVLLWCCSNKKTIEIPDSVTLINSNTFRNCKKLTSLKISNSVKSIGSWAFYGCSGLKSITIGNSVASIRIFAFAHCRELTSITIPDSVTSIGEFAFSDCTGLTSVTVSNSVTSIVGNAFYGCNPELEIIKV